MKYTDEEIKHFIKAMQDQEDMLGPNWPPNKHRVIIEQLRTELAEAKQREIANNDRLNRDRTEAYEQVDILRADIERKRARIEASKRYCQTEPPHEPMDELMNDCYNEGIDAALAILDDKETPHA